MEARTRLARISNILHEDLKEVSAQRLVDLLLLLLAPAELNARAAFRLGAIKSGALKVVGAVLNVRPKLLLQIGVESGALKESSGAETEPVESEKNGVLHTSSGCWESAAPIA